MGLLLRRGARACEPWRTTFWQRQTTGYIIAQSKNKMQHDQMIGFVTNDAHPRTVEVAVDRYGYAVKYQKSFRYTKYRWAHDEKEECRLGDVVLIQPMGQRIGPWKTHLVVKVLHKEPRDGPNGLRTSDRKNLHLPESVEHVVG